MKKRLRLNDLEVKSFITNDSKLTTGGYVIEPTPLTIAACDTVQCSEAYTACCITQQCSVTCDEACPPCSHTNETLNLIECP